MDRKLIEETIRWVGKKTTVGGYSERNIQILTDECSQDLVNFISSNPVLADSTPQQECYKTGETCKYGCSGLCKESCQAYFR